MKVKFQADANLNQVIVKATLRREPSIDFKTALAAGLSGLSDPEVLSVTASEGRVLVTHDWKTMPKHFDEFITTNTSPGVLIVPQYLPVISVVEDLVLIWAASESDEWINRVRFLPL